MNSSSWNDQGLYYKYLKDISNLPLLTRPEEKYYLKAIKNGDIGAESKLVKGNLRFVINIANLYRNQGMSVNELINEGNIGLIEAARRFDTNQEIKFISYAVWWVRQAITRAISEKARLVRISAEKELVLRRFNKRNSQLRQTIGGEYVIDSEDIANVTDYDEYQVEKIIKMGLRHSSLDTPLGDEGDVTVLDMISDNKDEAHIEAEDKSRKDFISQQLLQLTKQEQTVIKMYFGIDQNYTLNLQEIGKVIGLSKERVRQVKENGLNRLRHMNLPISDLLAQVA